MNSSRLPSRFRAFVAHSTLVAARATLGICLYSLFLAVFSGCTHSASSVRSFPTQTLIYSDDFQTDSHRWKSELESGGRVVADHGILDIDVPAGATVWFTPELKAPLMIEYKAAALSAGGPNDRVSDLNCFWMARDSRNPADLFAVPRSGKFADYNSLLTYYASIGGNRNTTTRFRRYIGSPTTRPIRPQDDLRDPSDLLIPNQEQTIQLIANAGFIEFLRNGHRLFQLTDDHPYTTGRFAFRTTASHLRIRDFRVYSLSPQ